MSPELHSGDYVVTINHFFSVKLNDTVVVEHPTYGSIVKRVSHIYADNSLAIHGNALSVSENSLGRISPKSLKGKVIYCIKQH